MSKNLTKKLKSALCWAAIVAVAIAYMPLSAATVSAASFSKSGKVSGVSASSVDYNSIKIKWKKYSGATGYQVYRATSKNGTYSKKKTTSKLSYTNDVTFNKRYYYKVRAYKKSNGKYTYSKFSSIHDTKTSLTKPVVRTSSYTSKIRVKWSAVPGATGYQVIRATSADGKYTERKKTKSLYYDNTADLTKNKAYYYKVRAYKKIGDKKIYGKYCKAYAGTTKLPAVTGLKLTATAAEIQVDETDASKTTETDAYVTIKCDAVKNASDYRVYRATSADGTYTYLGVMESGRTYKDTGVKSSTTYYYKSRAVRYLNGTGVYHGEYCSPVKVKVPAKIDPNADPDIPNPTVSPQSDCVKLSWPLIEGKAGYEVWRADKADGSYVKLGNSTNGKYTNDSLQIGNVYYYKVRAWETSGSKKVYGDYCEPVKGTTKLTTPTAFVAIADTSAIKLSWESVKNATGYVILRSTSQKGTYTEIGTTKSTSYSNTDVEKGKTYYYQIKAYITLNGDKYYSDVSSGTVTRESVTTVARGWLGAKEYSAGHKEIINLYNANLAPGCGKMSLSLAWCAAYVSAVGIKAKATDIIVRHSYCPTMLNTYKKQGNYKSGSSYVPKAGDIVFFDWNKNGVPDHVGMVYSVSGKSIKSIEGNKSDKVDYRDYTAGYSYVQGYGLPKYGEGSTSAKYTGEAAKTGASALSYGIGCGGTAGSEDISTSEFNSVQKDLSKGCGDASTDLKKMQIIVDKVKKQKVPTELACSKSEYIAAYLYELCVDADVNASVVTSVNDDGSAVAWIEADLDGSMYKVDPTQKDYKPVKVTPEATDVNLDANGNVIK